MTRPDPHDAAIARAVTATETALQAETWAPVKVIVLAEVLTPAGDRMVIRGATPDLPSWEMLGLLHHWTVTTEHDSRTIGGEEDRD